MQETNEAYNWEQARALAAIHEAGREIAASLDLDRTLKLVMRKAAETLPMDAGALFVRNEATQQYVVAASHNLPPEKVDSISFAFDEGVPGWVARHGQPLIVHDARIDERVHPAVVAEGVLSVLAVPLVTRERVVGVFNLFCQTGTNAFDDAALQLAQVFADQAAVFLENARLVGELRLWAAALEERVEERTRQLQEKQAQIIQAEKMAAVGRLAASVAHEINNPLQSIAIHLELAADAISSTQGRQQLGVVQQELDRIAGIVARLLDFQRPQKGEQRLVDVPAALATVLALTEKQLERAAVVVVDEVPEELPPVLAVENQLKQVFLNLILNAAEAMGDGGTLRIGARVEDGEHGGRVLVDFADTGPGFAPETAARLFEPFFTTKRAGSGLGLAVSHEIVASHGGTLSVRSGPGQGARFTVALPAASSD